MARDPRDESLRRHKEWIGYIQPVGLVVSPPALVDADCHLNTDVADAYQGFIAKSSQQLLSGKREPTPVVKDLKETLLDVFGWKADDLVAADDARTAELAVPLTEYGETLRPTYAVLDDAKAQPPTWLMLIQELPLGAPFDTVLEDDNRKWKATAEARFERLLRETQVPVGLLFNGLEFRLVYAPRGESPGHMTFPVPVMLETAGRPVFAALYMLLREFRVFGAADGRRLKDILLASRKYQSTVSTELSKQVLSALYELLRGIQAADAHTNGELLGEVLAKDPDQVYAGQLTVLLRLVFLLYAEDRGLMSDSEVYVRHYSVTGLFEKLRGDEGRHPDTMDQRYGAWARLLTLFRMVHDGAKAGPLKLPARNGYLFDPDRYPFLEGRKHGSVRAPGERITPPLVSDGVILRVLQNLLILDGERLSYRALDVEQIGSVYEAMMGFRVEVATGRSIAIKPKKSHGAPVTIDLEKLLAESGEKRAKWFKEKADLSLTAKEAAALKAAKSPEDAVAALDRKVAKEVTPNIVPVGSMVLQPSDERRRSGSHYTPRSLTEPIVRKALEPVLKQLGDSPTPEQLFALNVCDPAMGSGAFLVETCRQIGERVVKAWHAHACLPNIPPDEDELLHAQRLVAQRCLYGVDKNPMAVDLAKMSLWLTTLAKDHPFTFIDHALKCGDSLVGLTCEQIAAFNWDASKPSGYLRSFIRERLEKVKTKREQIEAVGETTDAELRGILREVDDSSGDLRLMGDAVVASFFAAGDKKGKERERSRLASVALDWLQENKPNAQLQSAAASIRTHEKPIYPFHWEVEFPEVFQGTDGGFHCIVGNPPFLGGSKISTNFGDCYLSWLLATYRESHGNADLVAHFFRRAFCLLRSGGSLGLISTNTVCQGDTRSTGLRFICNSGGTIYSARRRYRWPGQAAVVVSIVHIFKGLLHPHFELDGKPVDRITAYLYSVGSSDNPHPLSANAGKSFVGAKIYGQGFLFDDEDEAASPLSQMRMLIENDPRNQDCIFPYIGGEELNNHPEQRHHRYVIGFGTRTESEARAWPDLFNIVEEKVKPERLKLGNDPSAKPRKERWWQWGRYPRGLIESLAGRKCVFAVNCGATPNLAIARVELPMMFSHSANVFILSSHSAFGVLQSRVHEIWCRREASSMKDDLRYTSSDCFETFPFPNDYDAQPLLEATCKDYYEFRASLMISTQEGLTNIYNRFHDPSEQGAEIVKLRELHDAMDRAVLAAYGPPFAQLSVPPCEFLLDYEEEDDHEEEVGKRARKKPWRYRWPDAFRDEVLAFLLELNKQRAEAERKASGDGSAKPQKGSGKKAKSKATGTNQPGLFG